MNRLVVDTDVVSFLFKESPISERYTSVLERADVYISFMTVAELQRWTIASQFGDKRRQWLDLYLARFTVVHSTPDLCRKWAEVMMAARSVGRRIETADAWIAATALLYDVSLVTHNRRDYFSIPNLKLISHA